MCLKPLQRHAGPEAVVLAADSIELSSSRFLDKRAKLLTDNIVHRSCVTYWRLSVLILPSKQVSLPVLPPDLSFLTA